MSAERLFRALGLVDSSFIDEAMPERRKTSGWRRPAACLTAACLVLALGLGWMAAGGLRGLGSMSGGASGGSAGTDGGASVSDPGENAGMDGGASSGTEDAAVFMSYAGPVLPLSTAEDASGLTAERSITWDFAPGSYDDGAPRQWGALVTDAYVLFNSSEEPAAVTALYPFAGSFRDLGTLRPSISVDGAQTETVLYAGAYSGGFQSTYGASLPDTLNLEQLNSWTEYKALLESGDYLTQALADYPVLDIPVTVYQFSDFAAPHEQYQAATLAVSFTIDESATQIFTYGFNGMECDGSFRRYSCFVPDGMRMEPDTKVLVVLGEDIGAYSLQGYKNGGCYSGEEIEGVSCTVTRMETTFDVILDQLCRAYVAQYADGLAVDQDNAFDAVSFDMYRGAVSELLRQYGLLSSAPADRYSDGRLDDILSETLYHDRVLYLAFPVTVPAGGTVSISCRLWKEPSFDFQCSGSDNADLQGFDLMTRLGSSFTFTRQTAMLVNIGGVDISRQSFGFALLDGQDSCAAPVELDLDKEHFFLEVRPRDSESS